MFNHATAKRGDTVVDIEYEVDDDEVYATKLLVQGVEVTDLFDEIPGWAQDAAESCYDKEVEQWNLDLAIERKAA